MDLGRRSVAEWAESVPESPANSTLAQEKFSVESSIGHGGMGEVFLVTDRDLKRQVAMKILRGDTHMSREQRLHFVAEAQATSQLEHPGIPPVHDIGLTADGRPYFTMKLVRGRTLREVLHDLVLKRRHVQREYSLHRLVTIMERIAEALQFAHERGVVHRDIKPENVMLGDYGEVHLMDWGLARVGAGSAEYEQVETARTASGLDTEYGTLKGTLPYMSPEQASGEPVDDRSDLYALGCLLYEALTLHPAFDQRDEELFAKVRSAEFEDVATRDSTRPVPVALANICRKAMARDRDGRYASALELRGALRAWLDGRAERERRHEEAEALTLRGKEAAAKYERRKTDIREAEAAADAEAAECESFQPVSEKRSMIEARERVAATKIESALAFAEATRLFDAALTQEPDNPTARSALAELWRHRLRGAEHRGHPADTAHAIAMVQRYADKPIPSVGSLALTSDPPGADVVLYRYEEVDGVLTPQHERHLGQTPIPSVVLAMGSYLCVLEKEGYRDTRYPVHITRERVWEGEVKLRTHEEIGEGFVFVPAGPFAYGEGSETETKELPDFAIAKHPVTFGEYADFLDTLDDEEAKERRPHTENESYMEQDEDGRWRPKTDLFDADTSAIYLERHGEGFERRLPVVAVSWEDAVAYCSWRTKRTGRNHRLPTEYEREKAARGVDGRAFAWGDLADASLGKCRNSRPESTQLEPVGAFPTAESVYGMRDASGGVWDWTDSWFDERRSSHVLRGGSWGSALAYLRCTYRHTNEPRYRRSYVGFRCAGSL